MAKRKTPMTTKSGVPVGTTFRVPTDKLPLTYVVQEDPSDLKDGYVYGKGKRDGHEVGIKCSINMVQIQKLALVRKANAS